MLENHITGCGRCGEKLASISVDQHGNINILQPMQIFSVVGKNVKSCNNCNCFDVVKIGNIFVNKWMLMWHWTTVLVVVMMPWLQKRSLELAVSEIYLKEGYLAII
jgi:hypothetical protein